MKEKSWAKTLLSIYNCLENISNAIDGMVLYQGISSGQNHLTVMENAQRIIGYTERKKLFINTKVLIEDIVSKLDDNVSRILILKYFDKLKSETCANVLNLSRRTYFRKLDSALESFGKALNVRGFSSEKLLKVYEKERWIVEQFENNEKQSNTEPEINDEVLLNNFYSVNYNKLKKVQVLN